MKANLFWTLYFVVLRVTAAAAFQLEGQYFEPVQNTFLSLFTESSMLTTVPMTSMRSNKNLGCMALCSSTPNCSLSCNNGISCFASSALVSPYWNPAASPSQSLLPFSGYNCFSSWNFQNDITALIVNVSVSSINGINFQPSYAFDGYYSNTYDTHFASNNGQINWYLIDMGASYSIDAVVVKCRLDYAGPSKTPFFRQVEVRVGNSPGNPSGDFTANPILGTLARSALLGEVVVFKSTNQIVGRYISLRQNFLDFMVIGELKILGKKY